MPSRIFTGSRRLVLLNYLVFATYVARAIDHPEDFVNLLAGTFTDGNSFSTGNTLPLIGRPWGFNHWAPQTKEGNRHVGSWWFKGSDHSFTWMRCTHQPSPWIGDWGYFIFSPQQGCLFIMLTQSLVIFLPWTCS
jgi:putative alpha-1,2-mannosidase